MKISEIQINLTKPKNGLIGFASFVVNEEIYLSGVAIHKKLNADGYRLTYPIRKSGEQSFEVFYPINRMAGQQIESAILSRLNDVLNKLEQNYAGYNRTNFA